MDLLLPGMCKTRAALAVFAACVGLAGPVLAQAPVAVVEDVRSRAAGVEFMDYVAAGRVIKLGAGEVLVLGYMKSCWRETITGGTVTVGDEQSQVQQGQVDRVRVACATKRPQVGPREATQSAATVLRSLNGPATQPQTKAPLPQVQGLSPVFEVGALRGLLRLERTDRAAALIELNIEGPGLLRGLFFDLAAAQVKLSPGATYRATLGERSLAFEVAAESPPGAAPLLGRLLRFD